MAETSVDLFAHPQTERKRFPYQGPLKSLVLDQLSEQASSDLTELAALHNALVRHSEDVDQANWRDNLWLAQKLALLEARLDFQDRVRAGNGVRVSMYHTFRNSGPVSFLENAPLSRRAMVDTLFGEATVPLNAIQSKFYSTSPRTGRIIPEENLSIDVTGTFDKQDGNGLTDYEHSDEQVSLSTGDPELAFNGSNLDRWIRRIEFELDSDVDSVETQITVQVPASLNLEANVLSIRPHPNGSVDVTSVMTSADLTESFVQLSTFQEVENAEGTRWHFPAAQVRQVRIWLRQRDWIEENGKKVFYIGAEEVGLFLADWDKTYDENGQLTDNHAVLVKVTAPSGYHFATLHNFTSDPMYTLEDAGSRHTHFRIATDDAILNELWNSDTDQLPQQLAAGVDLGGTSGVLYVLTTLNWVKTSGGTNSPYAVNTPPFVTGFGLETTLVPE